MTLSLTTQELPDDVDGVLEATGVATRAPAFDGDLVVLVNGLEVDVPVVSVDCTVWARLPFTRTFSKVNPADYGAPDPARLMEPDTGLSSWLTAATGVEEGERVRDGEVVLSTYTGTLPGRVVDASIPSADEDADVPRDVPDRRGRPAPRPWTSPGRSTARRARSTTPSAWTTTGPTRTSAPP